jgi:GNAT superfamily N-acetyltransferase
MIRLEPEQFKLLEPFVPDLPDATLPLFLLETGRGVAWVDDDSRPRNIAIGTEPGGPGDIGKLFLFGNPGSADMRVLLSELDEPTEICCDAEMATLVLELYAEDTSPRSTVVYYFDRIPEEMPPVAEPEPRHLTSSDAAEVGRLLPAWAWRTYDGARDLVMRGGVYGVFEGDTLVAAAFVHDASLKYQTIAAATDEAHRRQGLAANCCRRLMQECFEKGKLPRFTTPERHEAAVRLAESLGFPERIEVTSYFVDVF